MFSFTAQCSVFKTFEMFCTKLHTKDQQKDKAFSLLDFLGLVVSFM